MTEHRIQYIIKRRQYVSGKIKRKYLEIKETKEMYPRKEYLKSSQYT